MGQCLLRRIGPLCDVKLVKYFLSTDNFLLILFVGQNLNKYTIWYKKMIHLYITVVYLSILFISVIGTSYFHDNKNY